MDKLDNKQLKNRIVMSANIMIVCFFIFVCIFASFSIFGIVTASDIPPDKGGETAGSKLELATGGNINLWDKQEDSQIDKPVLHLNSGFEAVAHFEKEFARQRANGGISFAGYGSADAKAMGLNIGFKTNLYVEEDSKGNTFTRSMLGTYEKPNLLPDMGYCNEYYMDYDGDIVYFGGGPDCGAITTDANGIVTMKKIKDPLASDWWTDSKAGYINRKGALPQPLMLTVNNSTAQVISFEKNTIRDYLNGYTVKVKLNAKGTAEYRKYIEKFYFTSAPYNADTFTLVFSLNRYGEITAAASYEEGVLVYNFPQFGLNNVKGSITYEQQFSVKYLKEGSTAFVPEMVKSMNKANAAK